MDCRSRVPSHLPLSLFESPHIAAGNGVFGSTLRSARSVTAVAPDHFGLQGRVIGQGHGDLLGIGDHVIVGNDEPGWIDDEPRAERCDSRRRRIGPAMAALLAEKIAEELVQRRSRGRQLRFGRALGCRRCGYLGCRNVDDNPDQPCRQLRKDFRKRGFRRLGPARRWPRSATTPATPHASRPGGRTTSQYFSFTRALATHPACRAGDSRSAFPRARYEMAAAWQVE